MSMIEDRLAALGLVLPPPLKLPAGVVLPLALLVVGVEGSPVLALVATSAMTVGLVAAELAERSLFFTTASAPR